MNCFSFISIGRTVLQFSFQSVLENTYLTGVFLLIKTARL